MLGGVFRCQRVQGKLKVEVGIGLLLIECSLQSEELGRGDDDAPCVSESKSTFADTRAALSMGRCCWSSICTLSTMMRFKRPRFTLPTRTSVPSFSPMASDTFSPRKRCVVGNCNNTTNATYRPTKAHSTLLIILFVFLKSPANLHQNCVSTK